MVSKKTAIAIFLLALIVLAIVTYDIFVPRFVSYQYKSKVQSVATPLGDSFRALNKTTELPLITTEPASEEVKKDNAEYISQLVTTIRRQIGDLKTVAHVVGPLPYSDFLGQYESAQFLEVHTDNFIMQTEDAIHGYELFFTYLVTFNKTVDDVTKELNGFNEVTDINIYEGQTEQMRQAASRIRANASLLSKTSYPNEMQDMNTAAVAAFNEAASGFEELADGLAIPADDPIYAAVRKIEKVTMELEAITGTTYDGGLDHSRIIKNVQDLHDKLELILGQ